MNCQELESAVIVIFLSRNKQVAQCEQRALAAILFPIHSTLSRIGTVVVIALFPRNGKSSKSVVRHLAAGNKQFGCDTNFWQRRIGSARVCVLCAGAPSASF